MTTIVSSNNGRNQIMAGGRCCSDSDEPNEQSYRTSLIAGHDNLSDSFSSSSDLSDCNQKDSAGKCLRSEALDSRERISTNRSFSFQCPTFH